MFKHYLKTTWRSIVKYPGYSGLNLIGLSLGMACAFMLLAFSYRELTYDQQFPEGDRIFRIASDFYNMGGFALSQEQLLDHLPAACPSLELSTRFKLNIKDLSFRFHGKEVIEEKGYYADSNFFRMFPMHVAEGNVTKVLANPDDLVISTSLAKKIFNQIDVVGRSVEIGPDKRTHIVKAVINANYSNTHLEGEYWLPLVAPKEPQKYWTNVTYYNYVKLHPQAGQSELQNALDLLQKDHAYASNTMGMEFKEWSNSNFSVQFFIQPLHDIYLYSPFNFEIKAHGNPTLAYALGIIGLFIILIAIANYLNLTTARASVRAKEVGVKKTLGISIPNLRRQFLFESIVFTFLAMLLGMVLTEILRISVEHWTGLMILGPVVNYPYYLAGFVTFSLILGLLAGIYPAWFLTQFQPQKVIKGNYGLGGGLLFRNGLVVTQFSIAALLIVGCLVVYSQLQFMRSQDLGLNQSSVMIINQQPDSFDDIKTLRDQLMGAPQISLASICGRAPSTSSITMTSFTKGEGEQARTFQTFPVDANFIPLMDMTLTDGRNFNAKMATDTNAIILNEAAVASLGLEDPIGKSLSKTREIIGIVSDFHYLSLTEEIEPTILTYTESGSTLLLKLDGSEMASLIRSIEERWSQIRPDEKLNYEFMDDNFEEMAAKEEVLARALTMFALLAIVIACLGLFGLVSFATHLRSKEMGIRKILGASTKANLFLLVRDFLKLIAIALTIAIPTAVWLSQEWLQDFAYRVQVNAWTYLLASGVLLVIALLTISAQSLRVALQNPADILRSE